MIGRERELCGGEKGAHAQTAHVRTLCVTPSRPRMLSWQQMASFNVHWEELHDLLQQRRTREKRSLGDWSHLRRQWRRSVEKSAHKLISVWR